MRVKMDPTIKDRWTERLNDGRPQATGYLEVHDGAGNRIGQCCLGVLCEIAVEDGVIDPPKIQTTPSGNVVSVYEDMKDGFQDHNVSSLPLKVRMWAFPGVSDNADDMVYCDPTVEFTTDPHCTSCDAVHTTTETLASLNDGERLTFRELAVLIDEQL